MTLWTLALFLVLGGVVLAIVGYTWGVTLVALGVILAIVVALTSGATRRQ